jgi:hypothetical protein
MAVGVLVDGLAPALLGVAVGNFFILLFFN